MVRNPRDIDDPPASLPPRLCDLCNSPCHGAG